MKKSILSIISVGAILAMVVVGIAACNNKSQSDIGDKKVLMLVDTAGFAQFQNWKLQHESAAIAAANKSAKTYAVAHRPSGSRSEKYQTGSMSSTSQNPAKAPVKKGWSKAAKGVAIGAGSGAILGAVINKRNRAIGAVIGGVAGGAVGYGIGRSMDKKDGRY